MHLYMLFPLLTHPHVEHLFKVMCPRCVITHGVHLIQRALLRMTFLHCLLNVTLPSHSSDVCWTAVIPRSLECGIRW